MVKKYKYNPSEEQLEHLASIRQIAKERRSERCRKIREYDEMKLSEVKKQQDEEQFEKLVDSIYRRLAPALEKEHIEEKKIEERDDNLKDLSDTSKTNQRYLMKRTPLFGN